MKKTEVLMILMPIIMAVIAKVVLANCFYVSGKDLSDLELKRDFLVKENLELKRESSHYSSLSYIKSEAVKNGFVVLPREFLETPSLASR